MRQVLFDLQSHPQLMGVGAVDGEIREPEQLQSAYDDL